jgi:hypothetical protein
MSEPEIQNTSKVITVSQDYIILGKSTKNTEIRINFHADDYEASKLKVARAISIMAYAESMYGGTLPVPPAKDLKDEKLAPADEALPKELRT